MPALHILVPIHDFSAGGTEVIAFRLAEQWLAAGCRVTFLAGAADGAMRARVPAGAAVEILDPPVARSALSRLRLGPAMVPALRRIAPDVVFIPGNFHFILAGAFKKALPRLPIAAKVSNPMLPGGVAGALLRDPGAGLLRRYLAPIDMVVTMNPGLEAEHRRMMPGGAVRTITDPNVPDDVPVLPMRDRRGGAGPCRLLLIGRLEPQKDVPLALRTLAALRGIVPAQLTILGEGYLRPGIEAEVKRLGLEQAVNMPGFAADIAAALDAADVLLITSRYEGGPAVAVEALARGVPVVSTDCSHFLRGLLDDARLGRIVSSRDPAVLAEAVAAQLATPPAPPELLRAAVEPSRYGAATSAYLELFAELAGKRSA
ncbi:MAG: glycosyltransferase [Proteobacteria bacterium]|nr:glycosyltransferase [Pseudomonadota bacterium]